MVCWPCVLFSSSAKLQSQTAHILTWTRKTGWPKSWALANSGTSLRAYYNQLLKWARGNHRFTVSQHFLIHFICIFCHTITEKFVFNSLASLWDTECVCVCVGGKNVPISRWNIVPPSPTVLMCGLPSCYQSNYFRRRHASYFCKQKQHHGARIDGFCDKYTFRLS